MAMTPPRITRLRSASSTPARTRTTETPAAPILEPVVTPIDLVAAATPAAALDAVPVDAAPTPVEPIPSLAVETPSEPSLPVEPAPIAALPAEPAVPAPAKRGRPPKPKTVAAAVAEIAAPVKRGPGRPRKPVAEIAAPVEKAVASPVIAKPARPKSPPKPPVIEPVATKPAIALAVSAPVVDRVDLGDAARLNQAAVATLIETNAAIAGGVETLSKAFIEQSRRSFKQAAATAGALLSARTFDEVVRVHAEFQLQQLDQMLTAGSHFGQLAVDVVKAGAQPMTSRVTRLMESGRP